MLRFKQFITEYLNPAQRDKVNSWLPDKESGRIYSPKAESISGHIMPEGQHAITIPAIAHTMRAVHGHLDQHGYTNHNYAAGTTTDKHGRTVNIGKALEKTKASDQLKNDFANDDRENAVDLENHDIVISRHPHHVAEASTNKGWKSCAGLTATGRFCRYGGGAAARKLPKEIEHGTHVAYLVPKLKQGEESSNSFPDIQKRIDKAKGRIYLKPHHSEQSEHTVLEPEDKVYQRESTGKAKGKNLGFLKSVVNFSRQNFPMNAGESYRKNTNVYDDDASSGRPKFNTSDESIEKILKSDDPRIKSELRGSKDLTADQLHKLIDYHDHPQYDKVGLEELSRNSNLDKSHIDKLLSKNISSVNSTLALKKNLHKSHVDHLVNSNDSRVIQNLIGNDNKKMLSREHLHRIVDNALSDEKAHFERGKKAGATEQETHIMLGYSDPRKTLRNLGSQHNLDQAHIDKIVTHSNNPYTHADLLNHANKGLYPKANELISDDHLKSIHDKWKDTDFSHVRGMSENPLSLAYYRIGQRQNKENPK
jgi:hypothetical protein